MAHKEARIATLPQSGAAILLYRSP